MPPLSVPGTCVSRGAQHEQRLATPSPFRGTIEAVLLDGNNLLGRLGGGSREGLVAELAQLARERRKRFTVVFDGPPGAGRPKVQALGDVTIVFAAPRTADEEILRRVQASRDPRGVTVVTDDRGLASDVSGAGARTLGVEEFRRNATRHLAEGAARAAETAKPRPSISAAEWERWFSDPKNRIE